MTTIPQVRTYVQAKALLDKRRKQGRWSAKLGNNIYLEPREGGCIAVRYHQTDIVTFYPHGKIKLRCGGWYTVTTKQNLSIFSPFSVYQEKRVWYVNTARDYTSANKCPRGTLPPGIVQFKDGMILDTPEWANKL
jgi:hypothetical protein